MTNGEKLCYMFPDMHYTLSDKTPRVVTTIGVCASFDIEWWNAEYKEPTTKNDLGVDCNNCKYNLNKGDGTTYCAASGSMCTFEQEPCEDAISRQAVMDCFKKWQPYMATRIYSFEKELSALPSVTPQEPRKGHWINDAIQGEIDGQIVKAFICSECGAISVFRITDGKIINGDLCPNCGAKMESEG